MSYVLISTTEFRQQFDDNSARPALADKSPGKLQEKVCISFAHLESDWLRHLVSRQPSEAEVGQTFQHRHAHVAVEYHLGRQSMYCNGLLCLTIVVFVLIIVLVLL